MSQLFTQPIETQPERQSDLVRRLARAEEEARLLSRAERVPLKARWRRSWSPATLIRLADLYPVPAAVPASTPPSDERRVVNFLRHERTSYDRLVHRLDGLQHGRYGSYESVYLVIKRRVHEKIAADFPWLADEAYDQYADAEEAVADGRWAEIAR